MEKAIREKGAEARNKVQLRQLETYELQDAASGLAFLSKRKDVDQQRLVVIGHSFGGALALLAAEHNPQIKAVVVFGAAAYSWDRSPALRARLITAVRNIPAPVMIIQAENDYSTNPGHALDSVMNGLGKPHMVKIYQPIGISSSEGHNLIFLDVESWVTFFNFLKKVFQNNTWIGSAQVKGNPIWLDVPHFNGVGI